MIKKNLPNEDMPDFDDMMNEAEQEIESHDAEDKLDKRLAALKKLNEQIETSTTNLTNAMLQLEHAFQIYRLFETNAKATVDGIYQKVDSIKSHADEVAKDLHDRLHVRVTFTDEARTEVASMFENHRTEVNELHKKNLEEVDNMLIAERKKTQKRFKEYDGTYFGHYVQWVFMFFFYIGLFAAFSLIGVWIAKGKGWL